ncbi:MAG: radical SAM protein [bacterium]
MGREESEKPQVKDYRFGLVYPNSYDVGMGNLAIHLLYRVINAHPYFSCERFFLFNNVPMASLETFSPLTSFDIIGFSISYELDYFNVIEVLKRSNIPPKSVDRNLNYPLIIAGGACMSYNPEPISDVFDLIVIGDGEETVLEILNRYREYVGLGRSKEEFLLSFVDIKGVYIPRFYEKGEPIFKNVPQKINRSIFRDFDKETAYTTIYAPNAVFGDLFLIEIERGCPMRCRFCVAGNVYLPCRIKSMKTVKDVIRYRNEKHKKIGLMGPLVGGIPYIKNLLRWFIEEGLQVSVSSLRISTLDREFLTLLKEAGEDSITIAPEFVDESLRFSVGKRESSEKIIDVLNSALEVGFERIKLYMMFGYDDYTLELNALERFKLDLERLNRAYRSKFVINFQPLIPKPLTPFQFRNMEDRVVLQKQAKAILDLLKDRYIKVQIASVRESILEGVLARGGRELFPFILNNDRRGILKHTHYTSTKAPWDFIN